MIDPNWKCERCGDCCKYVAGKDEWTYATLTEKQKETIKKQLKFTDRGCEALAMRDDAWVCLNQYLFGVDAKPPGCSKFSHRCEMTAKVKELIKNRHQPVQI